MILAEVPPIIVDIGIVAGSLMSVGVLLAGLGKLRAGKWLWRRIVSEPVGGWLDHRVGQQVKPVLTKLGKVEEDVGALKTQDRELSGRLHKHMQDEELLDAERQEALGEWKHQVEERFDRIDAKLDELAGAGS